MDIIRKYFPELNRGQIEQLGRFRDLIVDVNSRINLVSRKDIDHLEERHILHSLAIARFAPFVAGDTVLDVGTGGGFPGIPLAIHAPEVGFTLIDSIGKKVHALEHIIQSLGLINANCLQVRAENYPSKTRYVVSRAVTRLDRFASWVKDKIEPPDADTPHNGIYYLKGGDLQEEISDFRNVTVHPLNKLFSEPFFESKKLLYLPYRSLQ